MRPVCRASKRLPKPRAVEYGTRYPIMLHVLSRILNKVTGSPGRAHTGFGPLVIAMGSAVLLLAGCGDRKPDASDRSASARGVADINNALVGISCFDNGLRLVAITTTDGRVAARRDVTFPPNALPTYTCRSHGYALRQTFNSDFTRIAVTITHTSDASKHVGYMDVRSGELVDLDKEEANEFAAAPRHYSSVFDPSSDDIWYLDNTDPSEGLTVQAIDPNGGSRTTVATVGSLADDFIITGRSGNLTEFTSSGDLPLPNPSGTALAEYDSIGGEALAAALTLLSVVTGHRLTSIEGRRLPVSGPVPLVWVDDHTLVTESDISGPTNTTARAMQVFRFSADLRRLVGTTPLIPDSDRTNSSPVVSPDRTSVAFISSRGSTVGLYRVRIGTSAGQPTRIAAGQVPSKLLDWR